jgi:hypothetical protein
MTVLGAKITEMEELTSNTTQNLYFNYSDDSNPITVASISRRISFTESYEDVCKASEEPQNRRIGATVPTKEPSHHGNPRPGTPRCASTRRRNPSSTARTAQGNYDGTPHCTACRRQGWFTAGDRAADSMRARREEGTKGRKGKFLTAKGEAKSGRSANTSQPTDRDPTGKTGEHRVRQASDLARNRNWAGRRAKLVKDS